MPDLKVWKLENMPLMSDGKVRSKRCNVVSFYCPVCDMWHSQERKDTYIVADGEDTILICKEAYEFWTR
jgi:hypothetical protein